MIRHTLFAAAVAALACGGLHAQTASGPRDPAEVAAEAVAAAHSPDPTDSIGTRGFGYEKFVSSADPEALRRDAVKAASAPPPTGNDYTGGIGSKFRSTRDPAQVAAEARAAASAPDQNVTADSRFNSTVVPTMPAPATLTAGK